MYAIEVRDHIMIAHSFRGVEAVGDLFTNDSHLIPEDWLRKEAEKYFTPEEMAEIEGLGDLGVGVAQLAKFEDLSPRMQQEWNEHRSDSDLTWDEAHPAARDSYNRAHEKHAG